VSRVSIGLELTKPPTFPDCPSSVRALLPSKSGTHCSCASPFSASHYQTFPVHVVTTSFTRDEFPRPCSNCVDCLAQDPPSMQLLHRSHGSGSPVHVVGAGTGKGWIGSNRTMRGCGIGRLRAMPDRVRVLDGLFVVATTDGDAPNYRRPGPTMCPPSGADGSRQTWAAPNA